MKRGTTRDKKLLKKAAAMLSPARWMKHMGGRDASGYRFRSTTTGGFKKNQRRERLRSRRRGMKPSAR